MNKAKIYFTGIIILIICVLLFSSAVFTGCRVKESSPGQTSEFDFTLQDLEGNEITLSSLKGTVVVLNFWATWCPPCKAEIPDFIQVYSEYKDRNVEFLGISSESIAEVRSFVEEYGINYPVLIDSSGKVFSAYKVSAIPVTVLIDANGNIKYSQVGMLTREQLTAGIESMLE